MTSQLWSVPLTPCLPTIHVGRAIPRPANQEPPQFDPILEVSLIVHYLDHNPGIRVEKPLAVIPRLVTNSVRVLPSA